MQEPISFCRRLLLSRHALSAAKRMTVLQKPLNVYMMCSLYASVQGIDDSPFLSHGVLHGLWLLFTVIDSSNKLLNFKIYLFWIIPICEMFSIFNKM